MGGGGWVSEKNIYSRATVRLYTNDILMTVDINEIIYGSKEGIIYTRLSIVRQF